MVRMIRMTVEFEEEYYNQISTDIVRLGVDIVEEEDFESEDDDA